jgi:hypothetical protein
VPTSEVPGVSPLVESADDDVPGSVALMCAPPLLLIVTPGAHLVTPRRRSERNVFVSPVVVVAPLPVDVDPAVVDVSVEFVDTDETPTESVPLCVVPTLEVPVCDPPVSESVLGEDSFEVCVEFDESALATPGLVTIITPTPNAAAIAPTRPM